MEREFQFKRKPAEEALEVGGVVPVEQFAQQAAAGGARTASASGQHPVAPSNHSTGRKQ